MLYTTIVEVLLVPVITKSAVDCADADDDEGEDLEGWTEMMTVMVMTMTTVMVMVMDVDDVRADAAAHVICLQMACYSAPSLIARSSCCHDDDSGHYIARVLVLEWQSYVAVVVVVVVL